MDKKRKLPYKMKGKKRKKHRIRILRLLLVAAVFAAIIGLMVFLVSLVFATPETKVKKAYVKTMRMTEKRPDIFTEIVGEDIIELVKEGSSTQNIAFNINETNYNNRLSGVGVEAEINLDSKKVEGSADISVNYKNTPVFNFNAYTDNNQVLVSIPQLCDKVFAMENQNIMKQYSESVLGQDIEYTDLQDFTISLFNEDNGVEAVNVLNDVKKELEDIYNTEFERLGNKMTYEKLDEKKEIAIDGEMKKCKGYKVTAESDDVRAFVVNILKEVRTSKKIRSLMEEYAEIQFQAVPLYQFMLESSDEIVDAYYNNLDEFMEKISAATFENTTANIYVYKGVIAQMGARSNYTAEDESFVIQILGGMYGGKKPYEDCNFSLSLQDDTQMIKFAFEESTDVVDNVSNNKKTYTVGNGTENLVLDVGIMSNETNGSLSADATLTTPDGSYVTVRGNGTVEKSKKAITVVADEISIDYNNIYNAYLDGTYSAKPLEDKPEEPQGEIVWVFKESEEGINQIKSQIAENLKVIAEITAPSEPPEEANTETTTVVEE